MDTYDAIVLLRMNGNSDIATWVSEGGILITEWSAAGWVADGANLLNIDVSSNGSIGTGTSVTFSGSSLGVKLQGTLPNPYSDGGATEFFYTFTNIGSGVEILATRPTNIPAILGGSYGTGYIFVIAYDWADGFPSGTSNNGTLLKNALNSGVGNSSTPANPSSVTATANPICNGFGTTLTANGAVGTVYWYTGSCGGTQVGTGNSITVTPSSTTTYYARNNNGSFSSGCASLSVTVNQPSYVGTPPTVANLTATGTNIKWYSSSTGGTALISSDNIVNGQHYYASQTVNGVESASRMDVTAAVDPTPCAPAGSAVQTVNPGSTLANLSATGSNIRWYSAASGGTALPTSTVLVNGTHYYASQTVNCTQSTSRLDVRVVLNVN